MKNDTIISIMTDIVNDPDFAFGGIPTIDRTLIDQYKLTEKQASTIQVRLWKVFNYMTKLKKF